MLSDPAQQALEVLHDPLNNSQQEVSTSYLALSQLHEIKTTVEAVYKKPGTGMGNYWISFLKMSNPLAQIYTPVIVRTMMNTFHHHMKCCQDCWGITTMTMVETCQISGPYS